MFLFYHLFAILGSSRKGLNKNNGSPFFSSWPYQMIFLELDELFCWYVGLYVSWLKSDMFQLL